MTVKRSQENNSRHLRWQYLETLVHAGPPLIIPVAGTPRLHIFIEPSGQRIGLRLPSRSRDSYASPLEEVMIREVTVRNTTVLEVSATNQDLFCEFYALLCLIADRVQLEKQSVAVAVNETLTSWSALITRKSLLSKERQIGLLGELLFLMRVAKALDWATAAQSWLGPDMEEHDFALPNVDVEVKSTIREERTHHISSIGQLLPKTGRPLYLVSIQLTPAGASHRAYSLPSVVAEVLKEADSESSSAADRIRHQLFVQGWADRDAPEYSTGYVLRGSMTACHVSKHFPALTERSLGRLGRVLVERLVGLNYTINVEDLGVSDEARQFDAVLFGKAGSR